jgi:hypothetical protein
MTHKLVIILSCAMAISIAASAGATIKDVLDSYVVVRAQVERVDADGNMLVAQQRVLNTYTGLPGVPDDEFKDWSMASGSDANGASVFPKLAAGQVGLWCFKRTEHGLIRKSIAQLGIRWPVREGVEPRFGQALALAKMVEKLTQTRTEDDRLKLLIASATSDVPEVAVGSIIILQEGAPEELARIARGDNVSRASLPAQIAIDEAMCALDLQKWLGSKEREELLQQWASTATDDEESVLRILTRLDGAIQLKQIEPQKFCHCVRALLQRAGSSENVRLRAVVTLRWVADQQELRNDVFEILAPYIEDDQRPQLAAASAGTLKDMTAFTPEQLTRLAAAREVWAAKAAAATRPHAREKSIAQLLDEIIHRAKRSQHSSG